jgi:hypothetical protein
MQSSEWVAPWPVGYPAAMESAGSVAAPLLAGFSFALVGLIVPEGKGIRWPGVALAFLVAAGLLFIAAVQCGFWARQWTVAPSELEEWWPDDPEERKHAEQRAHAQGFATWAGRLRLTYRTGILFLLVGIAMTLVPPGGIGVARWFAIAIAFAGVALELLWIVSGWLLVGSPTCAYNEQLDVPKTGTRAFAIRAWPPVRWIARRFVPLVRIRI